MLIPKAYQEKQSNDLLKSRLSGVIFELSNQVCVYEENKLVLNAPFFSMSVMTLWNCIHCKLYILFFKNERIINAFIYQIYK